MTTVIARTPQYTATRFFGGSDRGTMIQLTPTNGSSIQLDLPTAIALGMFLQQFGQNPMQYNQIDDLEPMELGILGRLDTLETTLKLLIDRVEILAKDVQFTRTLQMETPHDRREA
jgi:hypothetical protein